MKMKKIILNTTLFLPAIITLLMLTVGLSVRVSAESGGKQANCMSKPEGNERDTCLANLEKEAVRACAGVTDVEKCKTEYKNKRTGDTMPDYKEAGDCEDANVTANNCGIVKYIVIFINTLTALAGVAIVGSIVYGGIQYSMAGSDPQKVAASKDRIRNAIIALILLLFGFAILNYLVPGGVLQG